MFSLLAALKCAGFFMTFGFSFVDLRVQTILYPESQILFTSVHNLPQIVIPSEWNQPNRDEFSKRILEPVYFTIYYR